MENNTFYKLQKDSIFKVGHVISVNGRTVKILVDKSKNSANLFYKGQVIRNVSVNSYIKIIKGFTKIIGKVEGEYTDEDKAYQNHNYGNEKNRINRVLHISLLGFFSFKGFERGIKELPLVSNECYLLDSNEYEVVHDFIPQGDKPLSIGTLTYEKGQTVNIGINRLFASHIGIFGNTGSGKSYTLSKIYNTLFKTIISNKPFNNPNNFFKKSKFVLIDFNGEYFEKDRLIDSYIKTSYNLCTNNQEGKDKFPIALKHVKDYSFWSLILEATEKTQMPFIRRALNSHKITDKVSSHESLLRFVKDLIEKIIVKEDRSLRSGIIIDFLTDLSECFSESNIGDILRFFKEDLKFLTSSVRYFIIDENGEWIFGQDAIPYVNRELDKLEFTIADDTLSKVRLSLILKYHDEIVSGFSNQEHLAPLINRIAPKIKDLTKLIRVEENPNIGSIGVVSLREVNVQMRKMLPFLICKQMYENKKDENNKTKSLNIIIDEAHNILSEVSDRESETWKDYRLETFEEIVKEGRKFGVFLTISSQRPSDISPTIISQLHNFFLHRLINNNDIRAVERTISYLDKVSFESLPIIPTGTCIFAGLAAHVPIMVDVGQLEERYEPDNKTINLLENWGVNND